MDNAEIRPVTREAVASRVPPYTFGTQTEFSECPQCHRVYWRGSHLGRFLKRLEGVVGALPAA